MSRNSRVTMFLCLQLRAGCISPLKNLRRLGVLRIQDFFDGFDLYSFSPDELDAVFQAVVWPQVLIASNFFSYFLFKPEPGCLLS